MWFSDLVNSLVILL